MKKIEFMSTDVRDGWYQRNVDGRVKGIGQAVFSLCHRDTAPINFLRSPTTSHIPGFPYGVLLLLQLSIYFQCLFTGI